MHNKPFPTDFWKDTQSKITFVSSTTLPSDVPMTAVKCIMLRSDKILLTKIPRGWDILTGHIELGETPEAAIRREVYEEVSADLRTFQLIGYLRSAKIKENKKNRNYPKLSAIPVYVSRSFIVKRTFNKQYEATDRGFFKVDDAGSVEGQRLGSLIEAIIKYCLELNMRDSL